MRSLRMMIVFLLKKTRSVHLHRKLKKNDQGSQKNIFCRKHIQWITSLHWNQQKRAHSLSISTNKDLKWLRIHDQKKVWRIQEERFHDQLHPEKKSLKS